MHFAHVRMVRASPSPVRSGAEDAPASAAHMRFGGSDRKVGCRAEHTPGVRSWKGATPGHSRRSRPT